MGSTGKFWYVVADIVVAVIVFALIEPSALTNIVTVPPEFNVSNKLVTLSAVPEPFLIDTGPNVELVIISGVVELLYACCNVVVDRPAVPPNNSPNLETGVKIA